MVQTKHSIPTRSARASRATPIIECHDFDILHAACKFWPDGRPCNQLYLRIYSNNLQVGSQGILTKACRNFLFQNPGRANVRFFDRETTHGEIQMYALIEEWNMEKEGKLQRKQEYNKVTLVIWRSG